MNIFIDIETIPSQKDGVKEEIAKTIDAPAQMKKAETIADWHNGVGKYKGAKESAVEEKWRRTALDATYGELVSVCVSDGKSPTVTLFRDLATPESDLLEKIFKCIHAFCSGTHQSEPYFIGHNVQFDLKFLWQRAVILGIRPPFKIPFGGRHKSDYYDNMQAWAGFGQRISQDNLAKALGIEGKPDDINGSNVWDFVRDGDVSRVAEYNEQDVETVIEIYKKINFK